MSTRSAIKLTPLAAAVSAAISPAGNALAQETKSAVLEEIIVTARKRDENMQEIPADVQALSSVMLEKMGAKGLEDYTRFIPSVNAVSYRPGSSDIVFRGVNAGSSDVGQTPASMYLDEMPITTGGNQPEVRMVDINRVEALSGPQGTLFGGSAQSGTLRVITNQPDVSRFEAIVDVTLKQGENTGLSNDISAVVNIPFAEKGALRLVGFTAEDAGFIDNVFGHTPDTHAWYALPATWGVEDNAEVVEDDWNGTKFYGGRVSLRWEFNDSWAATINYVHQTTDGAAGNEYDPNVGDLKIVKFNDEYRDDIWSTLQLVVEGDLGWAQLVSATSYFDREIETVTDSTVYTKYYMAWACLPQLDPAIYTGYFVDPGTGAALSFARYCFGNTSLDDVLVQQQFNSDVTKFTQEFRITGGSDRLNWIVGLFYEKSQDDWSSPWGIPTNYDYQDSVALLYWEGTWGTGFAPNATHGWHDESKVDWEQKAVFGEASWQLTDQWNLTLGARWFDQQMRSEYWVENPNTQQNAEFVADGIAIEEGGTSDFVPKVSVSYQFADAMMVYALYSEGFRPGGTNRGRGDPILPVVFQPDKLLNKELGLKTLWAEGRVRANLTYYDMDWEDYQLQVLDPSYALGEPWQQVVANVGTASVSGLQFELDVAVTDMLSVGMNMISLESQTSSDVSIDDDPSSIEIPSGTRLALAPEFKTSGWIDMNWETSFIQGQAFARLQYSYTGDSVNQIAPASSSANPQIITPGYGVADFRIGMTTQTEWSVDFFVSNLTDERAQYTRATGYFEQPFSSVQDGRDSVARIYTNRPREYGIRVAKRFGN